MKRKKIVCQIYKYRLGRRLKLRDCDRRQYDWPRQVPNCQLSCRIKVQATARRHTVSSQPAEHNIKSTKWVCSTSTAIASTYSRMIQFATPPLLSLQIQKKVGTSFRRMRCRDLPKSASRARGEYLRTHFKNMREVAAALTGKSGREHANDDS